MVSESGSDVSHGLCASGHRRDHSRADRNNGEPLRRGGRGLPSPGPPPAFSPAGEVVGHCFLVADKPGTAVMAVFVHQESRRRGIGATLVKAALKRGGAAGLRRVWAVTSSDNEPALRLQMTCGFRLTQSDCFVTEMEIDLPVLSPAWVTKLDRINHDKEDL